MTTRFLVWHPWWLSSPSHFCITYLLISPRPHCISWGVRLWHPFSSATLSTVGWESGILYGRSSLWGGCRPIEGQWEKYIWIHIRGLFLLVPCPRTPRRSVHQHPLSFGAGFRTFCADVKCFFSPLSGSPNRVNSGSQTPMSYDTSEVTDPLSSSGTEREFFFYF